MWTEGHSERSGAGKIQVSPYLKYEGSFSLFSWQQKTFLFLITPLQAFVFVHYVISIPLCVFLHHFCCHHLVDTRMPKILSGERDIGIEGNNLKANTQITTTTIVFWHTPRCGS